MPVLRIPAPLRSYTSGQSEVSLPGATVGELMESMITQFPALKPHLYDSKGTLRPFVNLFIGGESGASGENIKDLHGLETPLKSDDCVLLVPSIAGG
jgi:molybdopterin converting factor small subunit